MARPFQTDALTYNTGPSSSLGQPKALGSSTRPFELPPDDSNPGSRYEAELKRVHEGWNVKIDKEVKGLAKGLKDLVDLADIGTNPTSTPSPLPLQLRLSSLVRSTQNLRDMTHELKLLLLLSDQTSSVFKRDAEVRLVREEVEQKRSEVGEEIVRLFGAAESTPEDKERHREGVRPAEVQAADNAPGALDQPEQADKEDADGDEDEEMEVVLP